MSSFSRTWVSMTCALTLVASASAQRTLRELDALEARLGAACQPESVPTFGSGEAQVAAMTVYDDGSGPALYAAGRFERAGSVFAHRIARWDGTDFSALGSGIDGKVRPGRSRSRSRGRARSASTDRARGGHEICAPR